MITHGQVEYVGRGHILCIPVHYFSTQAWYDSMAVPLSYNFNRNPSQHTKPTTAQHASL